MAETTGNPNSKFKKTNQKEMNGYGQAKTYQDSILIIIIGANILNFQSEQ